ncbi:MAG: type II toxin-antitoxin system RelB/DinJ family antitoxin, partial [Eubacterium sp.]|nr:type II toxin-antitoxin system RelB/DinJ family antitoxin [Eubacterium sp.]
MAQSVNINLKLDADVKKSMELICSEAGSTINAVFIAFANKICKEKKIPFEITEYPEPNSITYTAMEYIDNGTDIYVPFDN